MGPTSLLSPPSDITPGSYSSPRHQTMDLPHSATDIWWPTLETCSNLFSPGATSGGGHWSAYGLQGGNTHPTGMLPRMCCCESMNFKKFFSRNITSFKFKHFVPQCFVLHKKSKFWCIYIAIVWVQQVFWQSVRSTCHYHLYFLVSVEIKTGITKA